MPREESASRSGPNKRERSQYKPQPELGQAIRHYRQKLNWTQEQLAEATEMHPTWISRLETGDRSPNWYTVQVVCKALGIRVSELAARAESLGVSGDP